MNMEPEKNVLSLDWLKSTRRAAKTDDWGDGLSTRRWEIRSWWWGCRSGSAGGRGVLLPGHSASPCFYAWERTGVGEAQRLKTLQMECLCEKRDRWRTVTSLTSRGIAENYTKKKKPSHSLFVRLHALVQFDDVAADEPHQVTEIWHRRLITNVVQHVLVVHCGEKPRRYWGSTLTHSFTSASPHQSTGCDLIWMNAN